jgi:DNA-binding transcriptional MocR family regulator
MSTEAPAERIAGDLALAMHEEQIRPGERLPPAERLMASYDVPPATVMAALERLSLAGVTTGDAGQAFAASVLTGPARQALSVLAAPAMCRRLAQAASGGGLLDDPEVLLAASEAYLAAGRRALRGPLTGRDAGVVEAAEKLLEAGSRPARPGATLLGLRDSAARSPGPRAADWPAPAADGVAAAAAGSPTARPGRGTALRRAAGQAPAVPLSP